MNTMTKKFMLVLFVLLGNTVIQFMNPWVSKSKDLDGFVDIIMPFVTLLVVLGIILLM